MNMGLVCPNGPGQMVQQINHIGRRMFQRGISKTIVEPMHGGNREKAIVGRHPAKRLLEGHRALMRVIDKGGIAAVTQSDALITTHDCEKKRH
jgi:hypothetical protein